MARLSIHVSLFIQQYAKQNVLDPNAVQLLKMTMCTATKQEIYTISTKTIVSVTATKNSYRQ